MDGKWSGVRLPHVKAFHPSRATKRIGLATVCLFAWYQSAAAQSVRIFNVDVYVAATPQCQLANVVPELRATISPFQETVTLGDVVTELARRAAQAGASVLYSIRLLSVMPQQGAQVTAIAGACLDKGLGPFNSTLVRAIYEAKSARRFYFPQSGSFGPTRSVAEVKKAPAEEIAAELLDQLRTRILSSVAADAGPRKSCPFEPSTGFQFLSGDIEAWWLVSSLCETAMLVAPNDDWRKSPLINLTPDAVQNFEKIQKEAMPDGRK
jgi:hypothetical protein